MLNRNFLSLFLFLLPFFALAQKAQIRGLVVVDSSKQPIAGATVALLTQNTQAYIRGQQTNEKGEFVFDEVDASTYTLRISYTGLENYLKENLVITAGNNVNLGTLELTEASQTISEVVVEGRMPDMQLDIDKKVFDVSQSLVSVGGTASDVLANVPTIQVDSDGSVSLRGSSNVRILIDGKESAMAGSDINSFLQSMPANSISKVEVITNPSSKYDAEGQSGIINIVLKKDARIGLNGSVTASAATYNNYMAGVNLNYRDNKFNYFGGYNFNRRNNVGSSRNDNVVLIDGQISDDSQRTISNSENTRLNHSHTFRFGADFYATEKTTLSLGSNISIRKNDRLSDIDFDYFNIPEFGSNSSRTSQQYEDDLGYDITFDFKRELKKEGEELTANVTFGSDTEDGTNEFSQTYASTRKDLNRNNTTTENGKNWNLQLDYVLPLGENHKFETGYRSIIRNTEDTQFSLLQDTITGVFNPDYRVSNDFDLKSSVHAVYANYQRQLSDRIGMQIGLRAEQAYLNSIYYSKNPDAAPGTAEIRAEQDYFRIYPTAFLTYRVGEKTDKIQLSYSRRVQRPRGWQVNPFLDLSDETNYRQGNPNLLPEDIHSFELSFAKFYEKWNFISSAYYRKVFDMVQPFQYDIDLIEDIIGTPVGNETYMKWENVGKQDAMGFELISKVNLFKWWDVTANANLFYNNTQPYDQFPTNSAENFSWNGNLSTNIKFTKTTSAQVRGDYRAPQNSLQGKMYAMSGLDIALRQDVLKGKGSIMFNVRDVFNTRMFKFESNLPTRYTISENRWMPRMFTLSFSYRFGIQDLSKNRKENNAMPEDMGGEQF
ncbi:TonB-dependent receptor [Sphingobacterium hungaricum]|uniref:TonB-dependent receptor n=1 Tax=Sphingobacterium hungaricum TaxID=2082723 RepID=A0A928UWT7_9SPHI|nr:TonB-dependent receptor [Sphingobacterium hungaricum]MBE8714751.1 TonB-dependent receptor [Sphingobacterium hungaricum]